MKTVFVSFADNCAEGGDKSALTCCREMSREMVLKLVIIFCQMKLAEILPVRHCPALPGVITILLILARGVSLHCLALHTEEGTLVTANDGLCASFHSLARCASEGRDVWVIGVGRWQ